MIDFIVLYTAFGLVLILSTLTDEPNLISLFLAGIFPDTETFNKVMFWAWFMPILGAVLSLINPYLTIPIFLIYIIKYITIYRD